jgi:hypothetical protein
MSRLDSDTHVFGAWAFVAGDGFELDGRASGESIPFGHFRAMDEIRFAIIALDESEALPRAASTRENGGPAKVRGSSPAGSAQGDSNS